MLSGFVSVMMVVAVSVLKTHGVSYGGYLNTFMLYSWVVLPAGAMLLLVLSKCRIESNSIIVYVSKLTYGIYLGQMFCFRIVKTWLGGLCGELRFLVALIVCVAIAIVLHELIQKPAQKYLNRRFIGL